MEEEKMTINSCDCDEKATHKCPCGELFCEECAENFDYECPWCYEEIKEEIREKK